MTTERLPIRLYSDVTRRRFLQGTAAAGMTAAGALSGLSPAYSQTTSPKRGGHFRLGVSDGSVSNSLDPATFAESFMYTFARSLHGYLVEVTPEGRLVGELAESWEMSPDARTWTFKLRPGVEFHNGKALDANDVLASINHHRGEQSKSSVKGIFSAVEDIIADGPATVVFKLSQGNVDFPYTLEHILCPIMPAIDGRPDTSGVGAGGYVLDSIEFGTRAKSKRFENYWKPNAAWFDSFEVLAIHDVAARTNALMTGQIHAMDRCDLKTIHLLERNKDVEISSVRGARHFTFGMLVDEAPFDNVDVRLALKYALDRQQLVDKLLYGYGQLGNDHPIPKTDRFFAKDIPQREQDLDKARFHLKKAGFSNLSVHLSASDAAFSGAVDAAVLYQEDAAKAGITIDVVREPNDGYYESVWMKKPWSASYWSGRPTPDYIFSEVYAAGAPWNETHWNNPRFNELLVGARSEVDEAKRRDMYAEMQLLCRDDGGTVIPVFADYVNAISNQVAHGDMAANWDLDGCRLAERWWFA